MATYNGYTNRATWNLMLWINNDEALYSVVSEMYEDWGEVAGYGMEDHMRELMGDTTPDGDSLDDVNWEEIVKHCISDFCL